MTGGPSSPAAPGVQPFRVGRWTVEPTLHRLSAEGRSVKLEPKAMALLRFLANRPGEVVPRDALLAAIWPGVVVGDDALTQVIVKLRKALGDLREEPAYIQTIAKGGYRLVAPVLWDAEVAEVAAFAQAPCAAPTDHAAVGGRSRSARWSAAAAVSVLLALVGVGSAGWFYVDRASGVARDRASNSVVRAADAKAPTVSIEPFEALTQDTQEVLLARGITADLVTDLSKVSGLWVIARPPGGTSRNEEALAGAPPARYRVSGTVQRIGDRLRLQIHLNDTETGRQLWSERFDRALTGLFEIQDEIGPKILALLPIKLSEAEARRVAQRYTRSLEAFETFHRGRTALHVRRLADNQIARQLFRRAIELDAGFARAYAGLAMTYVAEYRNQWTTNREAALDRAFELARSAQQIDPHIPETHWTLAFVSVHRHQHTQALAHLEEALRQHPSFADAYATMGGIYTSIGRPADSVPLLRTAIRLAPESGYTYLMLLGRAYLFLGDVDQARVNLQHALSRNPGFLDTRVYLAAAHLAAGDKAAASWEAEEIRALQPGFSVRGWLETNPTADRAQREKLISVLAELGF